jgi:hypothetical protein
MRAAHACSSPVMRKHDCSTTLQLDPGNQNAIKAIRRLEQEKAAPGAVRKSRVDEAPAHELADGFREFLVVPTEAVNPTNDESVAAAEQVEQAAPPGRSRTQVAWCSRSTRVRGAGGVSPTKSPDLLNA